MPIPDRVTMQPDGSYRWSAVMDREVELENNKNAMKICIGAAIVIMLSGVILSVIYHYGMGIWMSVALGIIIIVITIGVVHGQNNYPGKLRKTYTMHGSGIRTGTGRKTAVFSFKDAKTVIVGKRFIELRAKIGAFRAYLPEEDVSFVQGYILSRVPEEAEVQYE